MKKGNPDFNQFCSLCDLICRNITTAKNQESIIQHILKSISRFRIFGASIEVLEDKGSRLRNAGISPLPRPLKAFAEKTDHIQGAYNKNFRKSATYKKILQKGHVVYSDLSQLLKELYPRLKTKELLSRIKWDRSRIFLIPLHCCGTTWGVLSIFSPHLEKNMTDPASIMAKCISSRLDACFEQNRIIQLEQSLKEQKDSYERVLAASHSFSYIYTVKLKPRISYSIAYISDNIRDVLGYTPAFFVKKIDRWHEKIHPDDLPQYLLKTGEHLQPGVSERTFRFKNAQGRYRWLRDRTYSLHVNDDHTFDIYGSINDTTDCVQHETLRFRTERHVSTMMDVSEDLIFIVDRNNYFIYVNKMMSDTLAYRHDEMTGLHISHCLDRKSMTALRSCLQDLQSPGFTPALTGLKAFFTASDGSKVHGKLSILPLHDFEGRLDGYKGIFHDISRQRELEKIITEEKKKKDIINGLQDKLKLLPLGDVEDRLRTILSSIADNLKARRISIMAPTSDASDLCIIASRGLHKRTINIINTQCADRVSPVANFVYQNRQRIIVNNREDLKKIKKNIPTFAFFRFKRKDPNVFLSTPFITAPILDTNNLIGILNISGKKHFSENDILLIDEFIKLITIEISNERLFHIQSQKRQEKEILVRELNHRVKNNLQVIGSLLNIEKSQSSDPVLNSILSGLSLRISSMELVHRYLYTDAGTGRDKLDIFIHDLGKVVQSAWSRPEVRINTSYDIRIQSLEHDMIMPLGMIINELLSNCYKHGFAGRREGNIKVFLGPATNYRLKKLFSQIPEELKHSSSPVLHLNISDNGNGLKAGKPMKQKRKTLGTQIVQSFCSRLKGRMIQNSKNGFRTDIFFKAGSQ